MKRRLKKALIYLMVPMILVVFWPVNVSAESTCEAVLDDINFHERMIKWMERDVHHWDNQRGLDLEEKYLVEFQEAYERDLKELYDWLLSKEHKRNIIFYFTYCDYSEDSTKDYILSRVENDLGVLERVGKIPDMEDKISQWYLEMMSDNEDIMVGFIKNNGKMDEKEAEVFVDSMIKIFENGANVTSFDVLDSYMGSGGEAGEEFMDSMFLTQQAFSDLQFKKNKLLNTKVDWKPTLLKGWAKNIVLQAQSDTYSLLLEDDYRKGLDQLGTDEEFNEMMAEALSDLSGSLLTGGSAIAYKDFINAIWKYNDTHLKTALDVSGEVVERKSIALDRVSRKATAYVVIKNSGYDVGKREMVVDDFLSVFKHVNETSIEELREEEDKMKKKLIKDIKLEDANSEEVWVWDDIEGKISDEGVLVYNEHLKVMTDQKLDIKVDQEENGVRVMLSSEVFGVGKEYSVWVRSVNDMGGKNMNVKRFIVR